MPGPDLPLVGRPTHPHAVADERAGACQTSDVIEPLTLVSHELVNFNAFHYDTWVDLKSFGIRPGASDIGLLTSLLGHGQYHDHYAGQDPNEQTHHSLHGPYRLDAITPETFLAVSVDAAHEELRDWVSSWVVEEEDGPQVRAMLAAEVLPTVGGDSIFRLPDIRVTAEHDWGWVVGIAGFHEIVTIDRGSQELTLIVASDD